MTTEQEKEIDLKKKSRKWKIVNNMRWAGNALVIYLCVMVVIKPASIIDTVTLWTLLITTLYGAAGAYAGIGQAKKKE